MCVWGVHFSREEEREGGALSRVWLRVWVNYSLCVRVLYVGGEGRAEGGAVE